MTSRRGPLGLVIAILVCLAAGWLGSRFTTPSLPEWYAGLRKPMWTPPSWVFGPVWTALYVCMGVAVWLVWREKGFAGASVAIVLFVVQLALNVAWSGIFFGLHRLAAAFAELAVLWVAIAVTLVLFWRVRPAAGWLLVPYEAWVTFAGALNFAIWRLNA
jgi:tryptophan-rich sensory protein